MKRLLVLFLAVMIFTIPASASSKQEKMVVVTGKFVRVAGIGGESTGTAIKTTDGKMVEISINAPGGPQVKEPEVGENVQVQGYYTTVKGVERPSRKVLKVVSLQKVQ